MNAQLFLETLGRASVQAALLAAPRSEPVLERRAIMASHPLSVSVPPGANVTIIPEPAGRKVTGRANVSSDLAAVDWTAGDKVPVLKQPPLDWPRYDDFVTRAGWE